MKIRSVDTAVVVGNFDWIIVRVTTDEGLVGWGEGFFAPRLNDLIDEVGDVLVGEDPCNINVAMQRFWWHGMIAGPETGMLGAAASAVETALWDIQGQALGVPISRLLGGRLRDTVDVYADSHGAGPQERRDWALRRQPIPWDDDEPAEEGSVGPAEVAAHMLEMKAKGYRYLKFDLDLPGYGLEPGVHGGLTHGRLVRVAEVIGAVRGAVGDDVDLAIDCHWRFHLPEAMRLLDVVAPHDILWLEDPVAHGRLEALASLTRTGKVSICTGEFDVGLAAFEEIIRREAAHILGPDVQRAGGIGVSMQVAALAAAREIPVALHNISTPIGFLAAVHVAAAIPNFLALEFHSDHVPVWDSLVEGIPKPIVRDGAAAVPDGPGLGVRFIEEEGRRYAKPGTTYFGEFVES